MKTQIKLTLLRVLEQCAPYLLPEEVLMESVRLGTAPPALRGEVAAALRELEANRLVVGVRPALGGAPRWKLTAAGRAVLAEELP